MALEMKQVRPTMRVLSQGEGWTVSDVVCAAGPADAPFEEQHSNFSIAVVASGSFQYRAGMVSARRELMTPGSLLLGKPGQCFECGHEHGTGDRCVAFFYAPEYFESLAADVGVRGATPDFRALRVPPLRELSSLVAHACAGLAGSVDLAWEELGVKLAAKTMQAAQGIRSSATAAPPSAAARVTSIVRMIEQNSDRKLVLGNLARHAGLSPYHFLRMFERLTGLTPHQYVLRLRLRQAATRLIAEPAKVVDIALDSGFGDVSNFIRAFRTEFGVSPRRYRMQQTQA